MQPVATVVASAVLLLSQAVQFTSAQTNVPSCPALWEAAPKNMIRPAYPKDALRNGEPGLVVVRVLVSPSGKTEDITVLRGDPSFSESAVRAIRKWHFQPAAEQGHPAETVYKVHVRFNPLLRQANSDVEVESPRPETPWIELPPLHISSGETVHKVSEPGVIAPKALYTPEPEFSEEARKKKEQGTVNLVLVVGVDGLPRDLRVACSSWPDLIQNAIQSVRQWKFDPATKDGQPVPVEIQIEVSFKLN
jgi:TonB family protein